MDHQPTKLIIPPRSFYPHPPIPSVRPTFPPLIPALLMHVPLRLAITTLRSQRLPYSYSRTVQRTYYTRALYTCHEESAYNTPCQREKKRHEITKDC